jgi:uncharacterized repeat protein (TIGR02543 family)
MKSRQSRTGRGAVLFISIAFLCCLFNAALSWGWVADPAANSAAFTQQLTPAGVPHLVEDGWGGAFVSTASDGAAQGPGLYTQRLNANGDVNDAWPAGGGLQPVAGLYEFQSISDGAGGSIEVWVSSSSDGTGDLYAQRYDALGKPLWGTDGVPVCTAPMDQFSPSLVSDGSHGVIVVWQDLRNSYNDINYSDIYAQRIDASGQALWSADGIPVSTGAFEKLVPRLVSDGAQGAIIAWEDYRNVDVNADVDLNGADIYAQRIGPDGKTLWAGEVAVSARNNDQVNPILVSDGNGGAIIAWEDYRDDPNGYGEAYEGIANIYAQRLDQAGNVPAGGSWIKDGVSLAQVPLVDQQFPQIASDGGNGAFVVWQDDGGSGDVAFQIYAQRVSGDGSLAVPGGSQVSSAPGAFPQVLADDNWGAFVAWEDSRNFDTDGVDIYAQHLDLFALPGWSTDLAVSTAPESQYSPQLVSDDAGGAIIAWQDYRNNPNSAEVYLQRINADGALSSFTTPSYNVTFSAGGNGSLTGETTQTIVSGAACQEVTALAATGYHFLNWSDGEGGSYTNNPLKITVSAPIALTANFLENPINGVCGASDAGTFTVKPATALCSAGTASQVSGSGPWNWTCAGSFGGSTQSCSANIQSFPVNFTAGPGGSIASGATSQSVKYNDSTTAVSAAAAPGYHFDGWTGNNGFVATTCNPLTVSNVTSPLEIRANFALNAVDGSCGTSNGATLITAPATLLCATGQATAVTGAGPWSWSCAGSNGGGSASCSANIQSYAVNFTAGPGGSIASGATSQSVKYNGSTTAVSAAAASGYRFDGWTGNNGFVATTSNPLTVSNVTSPLEIRANFALNAVDGSCGSSNGATFTTAPATSLCATGQASALTGAGPWSWSCAGSNGGSSASCSANIQTLNVTAHGLSEALDVKGGASHTVVLKKDGTLVAWGGSDGQSDLNGTGGVAKIAAGTYHTLALKNDGSLLYSGVWAHPVDDSDPIRSNVAVTVPADLAAPGSGVDSIAGGYSHSVALMKDGTVRAWGDNSYGQSTVPAGLTGVTAIAAGHHHTVALKSDGTLVAWGRDLEGESDVPAGLAGVTAIDAKAYHTVALKSDGTVVAWGANELGQSSVPAELSEVKAIAAGGHHTVALKNDGTLVAWGDNSYGQITAPAGVTGLTSVAAGTYHTLAMKGDLALLGWGNNLSGQATIPLGIYASLSNGSVSCNSPVNWDGSSVCTITADPGFGLASFTVNGADRFAAVTNNSATLANLQLDQSVTAYFAAVPGAPTVSSASAGDKSATVTFSAPTTDGGSPITGYTVTSHPEGGTDSSAGTMATSHSITGLVNGTAYTFSVTASNIVGESAPSQPSGSLTPAAAATVTLSDLTQSYTGTPLTPKAATNPPGLALSWSNATQSNAGSYQVTATIIDPAFKGSASGTFTIAKANQTISVTQPAPVSVVYHGSFTVSATASSSLPVSITTSGPCSGGGSGSVTITMTGATGTCMVAYQQAGDQNNGAAPPQTSSTVAAKADQTFTITTAAPALATFGTKFTVAANASGGEVTYSSSGGCTNDGATFTMTSATTACTVLYDQAGNANYASLRQQSSVTQAAAALPGAPAITGISQAVDGEASVAFAAPGFNGGSPIIEYTVAASPGNITATGAGSPIKVSGLTSGKSYTFTVMARNIAGVGGASAPSAAVTPMPSGDLNGDGVVDIRDAMLALRIAVGLDKSTALLLARGDVGPLVNGKPQPDGRIDVGDVTVLLRKSVGLASY